MKSGKIWGKTITLLKTPLVEMHRIKILPNSYCSLHEHKYKNNGFYCVSGKVFIEVHKNAYNLIDITELGPGEFTTVSPGEYHKFFTKEEGAEVMEVYYPEVLSEDIVRKTDGGKNA